MYEELRRKISDRTLVAGVVGLGYVGLPLALLLSRAGRVFGFDIRPETIQAIRRCDGLIQGVERNELVEAIDSHFVPTVDFDRLADCDVIAITVGTPLTDARDPDLSQVEAAATEIARRLHPGQFIVLESTTYPGTTEEVLVPILESGGLRASVDFGVAYSPERIDPGNTTYRLEEIPKLVGGLDAESTAFAHAFYARVFRKVVAVRNARVAEASKMIENLFRNVNIALINEIALIMEHLGIDSSEAIHAASTKPFGFMPFYPGPGVGGHCIPLDPYYLSYRARKAGYMPRFIELSGEINEYMKFHTVELLGRGLNLAGKKLQGASVAILGLSFKKNVPDTRESPSTRIIEECLREGAKVRAFDPQASSLATRRGTVRSEADVESAVEGADAAVLMADHDAFRTLDFDELTRLMAAPAVWIDTRFVLKEAPEGSIALGIGRAFSRIPGRETRSLAGREAFTRSP